MSSDMEDKRKISTIYGLASLYGSQVDKGALKLWVSVLKEYPAEIVEAGAERLVKTEELVKMPAPAVLIRCIKEVKHERCMAEYRKKQEKRKNFEELRNEVNEKYHRKAQRVYDLCFGGAINGNDYEKRSREIYAKWNGELEEIKRQEAAAVLEIGYGQD